MHLNADRRLLKMTLTFALGVAVGSVGAMGPGLLSTTADGSRPSAGTRDQPSAPARSPVSAWPCNPSVTAGEHQLQAEQCRPPRAEFYGPFGP